MVLIAPVSLRPLLLVAALSATFGAFAQTAASDARSIRDGVLVSADHVLGRISPTVGLWPASREDPLGDYLEALERTIELAPTIALPGHGDPVLDPVGRAQELIAHHRERLDATAAALVPDGPRTGFEVSFPLFGDDLKPAARRFAVAEALSHLERLVREGRAARHEDDGTVSYTAAQKA